jgi:hypothetical protein
MTVDCSSALAVLDRTEVFCKCGWIEPAALAAEETIIEHSARGEDADGNTFTMWSEDEVYSPRQEGRRRKLNLSTHQKDIRVKGDLLGSLKLRRVGGIPQLAVADDAKDKLNRIAHGQMYHPKWRYHHKFLAVGREMILQVKAAIIAAF